MAMKSGSVPVPFPLMVNVSASDTVHGILIR
jgi:hypothetical protein